MQKYQNEVECNVIAYVTTVRRNRVGGRGNCGFKCKVCLKLLPSIGTVSSLLMH